MPTGRTARDVSSVSNQLTDRLFASDSKKRIFVSPLLDNAFTGNSLDLRLGTKFILTKPTRYESANPLDMESDEVGRFLENYWIELGQSIVLHPRMFMLATTLEYISLPSDLSALINGRSSYGRLGILTVTAPVVHAGYKGCLTLEILNAGDSPVVLSPGLRIAQLTLMSVEEWQSSTPSMGRYQLATEPEYPKLWQDKDLDWLRRARDGFASRGSH
jgi:dCTP deaminase